MKRLSIISTILIAGLATSAPIFAEEPSPAAGDSDQPKLTIKPSGRVLLDGALFLPNKNGFADGVAIPDVRIGASATYGKVSAKIDIGYGLGKISLKDVYLQYTPNANNFIRGGYFVQQFGLNSATSSAMKPTMIATTSDSYLNATGRNLGIMYVHDQGPIFLGVTAFTPSTTMTTSPSQQGKISVGAAERFVWRPIRDPGQVVQVGFSSWYQTAEHTATTNEDGETVTSPGFFKYSIGFPTKVESVPMLSANIQNAKTTFRLTPELLLSKGRLALEGQYYYMNVSRDAGFHNYTAQGGYALLRCLLVGDSKYSYSHADAGLATPGPKSLECVLGYDYMNATDIKAGINGGISNDYSVTFNYYINKYLIARLRYSYTNVRASDATFPRHENIIQARIMFKF
ncbi:MAG: ATPase [Muribaculaceae bacterium]|nr:ATPase [Muribaculaceae bacterium]MDE6753950.1 ATPase [Muribaculaceae bacterium]